MTDGQVLYRCDGDDCLIKLVGSIRYTLSPRFEAFIRDVFSKHPPVNLRLDMTETDHIGSTNLGLLARLAQHMSSCDGNMPVISTHHDDLVLLFETMGFDYVFKICSQPPVPTEPLVEIPDLDEEGMEQGRTILDEHEMLMNMNARNQKRFQDAVTLMREEIKGDDHE